MPTGFVININRGARRGIGAGVLLFAMAGAGSALERGAERIGQNEPQIAAALIEAIEAISLKRYPDGRIKRFNQTKTLACVDADFHVPDTLPAALRQGLFARPGHYRATIRFANASSMDDRDKDLHGMSIKVSGVPGQPLWGAPGRQDFLLNSYPALFAGTPQVFLDFVEAGRDDALWKFFLNPWHLDSLWILVKAREKIASPLAIRYWSTTPYRFGSDTSQAVKYSVRPCAGSALPRQLPADADSNVDYLSHALRRQLAQTPACFDFMVQFQSDPQTMPIEDASVIWDENAAPFQPVARITIAAQPAGRAAGAEQCEALSFNPWQSLAGHRPLGGINRVRRQIYAAIAQFRNSRNR